MYGYGVSLRTCLGQLFPEAQTRGDEVTEVGKSAEKSDREGEDSPSEAPRVVGGN